MRLMLQFKTPVQKGNEAEADDSLPQAIKNLVDTLQPEAAFFYMRDGKRAGMVVFEESDAARLTAINEPLFAQLNAEIDITPALNLSDLMKNL